MLYRKWFVLIFFLLLFSVYLIPSFKSAYAMYTYCTQSQCSASCKTTGYGVCQSGTCLCQRLYCSGQVTCPAGFYCYSPPYYCPSGVGCAAVMPARYCVSLTPTPSPRPTNTPTPTPRPRYIGSSTYNPNTHMITVMLYGSIQPTDWVGLYWSNTIPPLALPTSNYVDWAYPNNTKVVPTGALFSNIITFQRASSEFAGAGSFGIRYFRFLSNTWTEIDQAGVTNATLISPTPRPPTPTPRPPTPAPIIYCNNPTHTCPVGYRCVGTSACPPGVACIASVTYRCISLTPTPLPTCTLKSKGDANCNGVIEETDLTFIKSKIIGLTSTCTNCSADFNNDGRVDLIDFEIWRNTFTIGISIARPPVSPPINGPTSAPCVDVPGGPICGGG